MSHSLKKSNQTYLIRAVQMSDLEALLKLVQKSSGGLSSLQPRRDFLENYIKDSLKSFSGTLATETPHKYLMVMIDVAEERLIGCVAVKTNIGIETPFINFDLHGDGEAQVLRASSRFTGATEVGSLFLDSDYRDSGLGRYLTKVRYLLMAREPWRFGETVIAELRGVCGTQGSPLYDHLFEYKLDKTFLEADTEYFDRNPNSLGDIVPIGPVSVYSMPLNVKSSLAQPHPSGTGAMRLLQGEGFIFSGTVDLFDGGPIMTAHRDTIRTIMDTKTAQLSVSQSALDARMAIVTSPKVKTFRAVISPTLVEGKTVIVSETARDALDCDVGSAISYWQAGQTRRRVQALPQIASIKA